MQLELCPFCGTDHALMPDASGRYQQIVCGSCGARGPEVYRFLPYSTAAQSWNVRQSGPTDGNTTHRAHGIIGAPGVAAVAPSDEAEFCIEDAGGMFLASAQGQRAEAWREIQHYAAQYADEGPLTIYEVTRKPVTDAGMDVPGEGKR